MPVRMKLRPVRTTTHDINTVRAAVRMAENTDCPTLQAALDALIVAAVLTDPIRLREEAEVSKQRYEKRKKPRMFAKKATR